MENWVDLTEKKDNGVRKLILTEGKGDQTPGENCTVYVHYTGYLGDDIFDCSRQRSEEFKFQLGVGQVIKAWDIGVASMKKGESCRLECAPEYAYGENGSPPKIPPNSTLIFEVELIRWTYEDISPEKDESIQKKVIAKGDMYTTPKDLSVCTVHLRGHSNEKVFDERDVTFVVGEAALGSVPQGIEIAVQTMKKGEKSEIYLKGKYAKDPKIPPGVAEVSYTVRLNNFEKAKDCWEMNSDEKLEASESDKAKGTEHFKGGRLEQALKYYKRVHEFMKSETSLEGDELTRRNALYSSALLNMALVNLKFEEFQKCIENCDEVLTVDDKNVKALFRRGQAKFASHEYDDAASDFKKCSELDPSNKAALEQLRLIQNAKKIHNEREKNLYKNMFSRLSKHDSEEKPTKPEEGVWTNTPKGNDADVPSGGPDVKDS